MSLYFYFNDTATTDIYTLSLHDALPISVIARQSRKMLGRKAAVAMVIQTTISIPVKPSRKIGGMGISRRATVDRKSTRLNSSHSSISYAVFCLKKKKQIQLRINLRLKEL